MVGVGAVEWDAHVVVNGCGKIAWRDRAFSDIASVTR
jgi:hypothetical protein